MRLSWRRSACIAMLLGVLGATPSPTSSAIPTTAPLSLSMADFVGFLNAAFTFLEHTKPVEVAKPFSEMPQGLPSEYYAGKDPSGRPILWETDPKSPVPKAEMKNITQDLWMNSMGIAGFMAAADAGAAGPYWKRVYDSAPDKAELARTLIRKVQTLSDAGVSHSRAQLAWLHSTLRAGMSRSVVYSLLKSRGLVAYNQNYNPGKATFGQFPGCNYEATHAAGNWPRFKQPLPHQVGVCADISRSRRFTISPPATIEFGMGFNFACGNRLYTTLWFDAKDKLKKVEDSKVEQTCL